MEIFSKQLAKTNGPEMISEAFFMVFLLTGYNKELVIPAKAGI
jgi:hypothetical protein